MNDLVSWFVWGYQLKWVAKQAALENSHNKRTTSYLITGKYRASVLFSSKRLESKWYHQKKLVKATQMINFTKTKLFSLYRRFLRLRTIWGVSCPRYELALKDTEVHVQFLDFPNNLRLSVLMNQIYCMIMFILGRILSLPLLIVAEFHLLCHNIISLLLLSAASQTHWKN